MQTPTSPHARLAHSHPAVHLAPATAWMNDPNGLCAINGTYHAFYQHNPDADVWGPMHWRHATSPDLVRWTDRGIALWPDELGAMFSGSVVIDHYNTAGFGADAMVALFTHDLDDRQSQSIAVSHDQGTSWVKYRDNPVLADTNHQHFRDPKVFWHGAATDGHWVMCLAVQDHVRIYTSPDLKQWEHASSFRFAVDLGGLWECPDLVALDVGDGMKRWLMLISIDDAGPPGHSGVLGLPGSFDGQTFTPMGPHFRIDHGPDHYATQTFHGRPSGEVVAMSWMNSIKYTNTHPSAGRRGVQTIPRRFWMTVERGASELYQRPVATVADVRTEQLRTSSIHMGDGQAIDIESDDRLTLTTSGESGCTLHLEVAEHEVVLQRHGPEGSGREEGFTAPRRLSGPRTTRVIVDHGTIEVFADGGRTVMSALFFAGPTWRLDVESDARVWVLSP